MSLKNTRTAIYDLLNPDHNDTLASNAINFLLIGLIIANVIAISLQTIGDIELAYAKEFFIFELFSVAIFTIEFLLRLWTVSAGDRYPNRRRFLLSFDSGVDIISILPLYLSLFFGIELRALIALRIIRLLKLVRYFSPVIMLGQVIKAEARAFVAAIFILIILVFVSASGIYFLERDSQPEHFGSIPAAMWWATVTLTTLGYGDVVPVTDVGKIFAGVMTILSIGTVALPAGMLASRFSEELHKRKQTFSGMVSQMQAGGRLNGADQESLERTRRILCISKEDAEAIEEEVEKTAVCPHCLGSGKINSTQQPT